MKMPLLHLASSMSLFAVLMTAPIAHAESDNSVREISRGQGSPVEVLYNDGRVASVVRKEKLDEFRVPIQLNENTCKASVGIQCFFVMPFVKQQYAAIWKRHPTRQGQPLEYTFNKAITFGVQNVVTRSQAELFDTILRRIPATGEEASKIQVVLGDKSMGRIECPAAQSDLLAASLPRAKEILYWDENFELGNTELAMSKGYGARVNQTWRRFEGFDLTLQGSNLKFARFKKAYGMLTDYYPMGISYQIQMTFMAQNIIEPDDQSCALKWDINFTNYFTQLLSVLGGGGPGTMNPQEYQVFPDSFENQNPYAQKAFSKELWEDKGMQ